MTPDQFRGALDHLDLTQVGTADLFGVNPRTVRDWVSGETRIPETAAILLRLMVAGKLTVDDVESA